MPNIIKILAATLISVVIGLLASLSAERISDNSTRLFGLEQKMGLLYEIKGKLDLIINHFKIGERNGSKTDN